MSFKDWFNEDDHDLYNYPVEAMEAAWSAGIIAEQAKNLKLCQHFVAQREEIERQGKEIAELKKSLSQFNIVES